jgi:hypothetical protein
MFYFGILEIEFWCNVLNGCVIIKIEYGWIGAELYFYFPPTLWEIKKKQRTSRVKKQ